MMDDILMEIEYNCPFKVENPTGVEIIARHIQIALEQQKRAKALRDSQRKHLGRERPTPSDQLKRDIKTLENAKAVFLRYSSDIDERKEKQAMLNKDIEDLRRMLDGQNAIKLSSLPDYGFRTKQELGKLRQTINNELSDHNIKIDYPRALSEIFSKLFIT